MPGAASRDCDGNFWSDRYGQAVGLPQTKGLARALPDFDGAAIADIFGMAARGLIVGEREIGRDIDAPVGPKPVKAVIEHDAHPFLPSQRERGS
jgi:hypothetical protein